MSGARIPNWADGPRHELAELARQVAERVVTAPWNCSARTMYRNPSQVSGRAVDQRRAERPGAQRQLEVDERRRSVPAPPTHAARGAAARQIRGSTARTYSPTGMASSSVSEWLPTASPKTDGRRDQVAVAAVGGPASDPSRRRRCTPPVQAAGRVLPRDQQPQQDRDERQVERVRLGVGGRWPRRSASGQPDPGRDARARAEPVRRRTRSTVTPAATATTERRRAGSSGRPARRTAGGRPRRASRAGRRSGSRSGGPCPSAVRPPGARPCPRTRRPGSSASDAATKAIEPRPAASAASRAGSITIRATGSTARPTG